MKSFFLQLTLISILIMIVADIEAEDSIPGEYYMHGVMETASGFQLNSDSSFQFFYSYGALDRSGKGKWSLRDDSVIVFNSEPRPPLDFKLVEHKPAQKGAMIIQVTDNNKNILRYVHGVVKTATGEKEFAMNKDG